MAKIVLIGDIGGHSTELVRALELAGAAQAATTGQIPDDVTILQVGDLIDGGPDSSGVIEIVNRIFHASPERWVQLIGNHDARLLEGHEFSVRNDNISHTGIKAIHSWDRAGWLHIAAAINGPYGETLVTHAGLTAGLWDKIGSPSSPAQAVAELELLRKRYPDVIHASGVMLNFGASGNIGPRMDAGPLWAAAGQELYESWLDEPSMPFNQIHGHTSALWWDRTTWTASKEVRDSITVRKQERHVRFTRGTKHVTGIDPCFTSRKPDFSWAPLILENCSIMPTPELDV